MRRPALLCSIRIEIKNKKTGSVKCFGVNRLLSRKSSDGVTKIVLTIHSNYPCDQIEDELKDLSKNIPADARQHRSLANPRDFAKRYIVTVKTGKKILSGTNADVFVRLYDEQNRQSEEILLEQSVTNKTPFGRDAIDEFHVGTRTDLADLKKVHLWHTGDKHDGWNVQWLQIEDVDAHRLYCFPVVCAAVCAVQVIAFLLEEQMVGLEFERGKNASDSHRIHGECTLFDVG